MICKPTKVSVSRFAACLTGISPDIIVVILAYSNALQAKEKPTGGERPVGVTILHRWQEIPRIVITINIAHSRA